MSFSRPELRAVLFDLDGTLLDTIGDISGATNTVLRRHGLPGRAPAEFISLVGWGIPNLVRKCIPADLATDDFVRDCVAEMKAEYAAHPVDKTRAYEGVVSVLDELSKRGYGLAVLSNKAHELTTTIVEKILPGSLFVSVQGQKSGVPPKPDPEAALSICGALGTAPGRVLYVGDSGVDMETARNAGMVPLGVSWGYRDREELIQAGASIVIDDPHELLEILPGTNGQ